jgi:peptidyl-prolyl cis-trans isomerase A (cyclophilin A)
MIRFPLVAALALALAAPAFADPALVKVSIKTSAGTIVVAVDTKHAPITAKNFLAYVDKHNFDGTTFYRTAKAKGAMVGFVQGGTRHNAMKILPPIAHEPTTKTGLRHVDGTLSMAREAPGSATGDFFITVGTVSDLDAHPGAKGDNAGYAAFGHVVSGMPVVKTILKSKTVAGGSGPLKGQIIADPVKIIEVKRVS